MSRRKRLRRHKWVTRHTGSFLCVQCGVITTYHDATSTGVTCRYDRPTVDVCTMEGCSKCAAQSAESPPPVEHHSERLRRLVGEVHAQLVAAGLSPADAVWVAEGAADRVRREAEQLKKARGGR